jgi:hypothetical protein
MSTRVYREGQNPSVEHYAYRCSDSSAQHALAAGRAIPITDGDGRRAILLTESHAQFFARDRATGFHLSANNVLAFMRTDTSGDKLHYEIPMAGDKSALARSRRTLLHPSSRSYFRNQILPVSA